MKTYVITVSRNFPGKHPRKGEETCFIEKIKSGVKLHTIRGNYELWVKRFEKIEKGEACLSLRYWEGKPYSSKQVEFLRLDKSDGIGIQKVEFFDYLYGVNIDDRPQGTFINVLAKNDGLNNADFESWFRGYDLSKPMALIHFTKFRY